MIDSLIVLPCACFFLKMMNNKCASRVRDYKENYSVVVFLFLFIYLFSFIKQEK